MGEALDTSALARWRRHPLDFISQVLVNPDTGRAFDLFEEQHTFFEHAWQLTDDGRLRYPEQCFGAIKKTGKSATAAMHLLTTTLVFGGRFAEGYCAANDLEQAQSRVFQAARRIVEASPYLKREADITQSRITFPQTGATVQAIAGDYAGAAGGNPTISAFDELWGVTSEKGRRLWDEMVPSPVRQISCRLTTTYAGFEGESVLLADLYKRGMATPQIGTDLRAGDGMLFFWSHVPLAPWQTESWLSEMRRSLRPNQFLRMIENRWVSSESSFIDLAAWDACVQPNMGHTIADRTLSIWVGVDASTKHDSTAIVAVTFDEKSQQVRLVTHKVFQPSPDEPLDFEATVEATLLDLHKRFLLRAVLFDPWQLQSSMQRLTAAGLKVVEFPQSPGNLTAASQNLYDLVAGRNLAVYPDAGMRLAVSRAVAIETARGWRIGKDKQTHKIDVVVALAMASHGAVQSAGELPYDTNFEGWNQGGDGGFSYFERGFANIGRLGSRIIDWR